MSSILDLPTQVDITEKDGLIFYVEVQYKMLKSEESTTLQDQETIVKPTGFVFTWKCTVNI